MICCLLIFVLAFIVHAVSLYSYFFADDLSLIVSLQEAATSPGGLFSLLLMPWQPENTQQFWRPLGTLSYMLDFLLWQNKPCGYHLSNLIVHSFVSVLIYLFSRILLQTTKENQVTVNKCAFVAALLFAVSPLHAEPVLWIVGRPDLLATGFALASLIFSPALHIQAKESNLAFSLLLFMFSLLSKETAAALPLMIFCLGFACRQDLSWPGRLLQSFKQACPYFFIFALWLLMRWLVLHSLTGGYLGSVGETTAMTAATRLFSADIIWKIIFPFNEQIFSMSSQASWTLHALYIGLGVCLLVSAVYFPWSIKRWRLFLWLCLCSIFAILPVVTILHLSSNLVGGRLVYFASAFISIFSALLLFPDRTNDKTDENNSQTKFLGTGHVAVTIPVMLSVALISIFSIFSFAGTQHWLIMGERLKNMQAELHQLASERPVIFLSFPRQQLGVHMLYSYEQLQALLSPPLVSSAPAFPVVSLFPRQVCDYEGFNRTMLRLMCKRYPEAACVVMNQPAAKLKILDNKLLKALLAEHGLVELNKSGNAQPGKGASEPVASCYLPSMPAGNYSFAALEYDRHEQALSTRISFPSAISGCDISFLSFQLSCPDTAQYQAVDPLLAEVEVSGWAKLFDAYEQTKVSCYLVPSADRIRISTGESLNWLGNRHIDSLRLALRLKGKDGMAIKDVRLSNLRLDSEFALKPLFLPASLAPGDDGLLRARKSLSFYYDVSSIEKADGIYLQISKPFSEFVHYSGRLNDINPSQGRIYEQNVAGRKGQFTIDVPDDGQWRQVSICAVIQGRLCGHFSDPLTFVSKDN